jgi:hypothetical protein
MGEYAVSNLLIVESENDKYFIERLKKEVNNANFEIDNEPICNIDDYECLSGLSVTRLSNKLFDVIENAKKDGIDKIGIMLDADDVGIAERVNNINQSIRTITDDLEITAPNQWYRSEKLDIEISCHILNVSGLGDLETLLKEIKSQDSTFADCLYSWQECLAKNNKEITIKDFDKFWINIYGRYDHCNKNEQKQAGRKCNLEASLQKNIWNFSHPALTNLKDYLAMFN